MMTKKYMLDNAKYIKGEYFVHPSYGVGKCISRRATRIQIDFDKNGVHSFKYPEALLDQTIEWNNEKEARKHITSKRKLDRERSIVKLKDVPSKNKHTKTDLSELNLEQKDAILSSMDKNIVLLAGAGSGKTRTLIKRVEFLLNDKNVSPSEIMVVTFTSKAAREIRERMSKATSSSKDMWIGTIHSICCKILRQFGGIHFTILDGDRKLRIIYELCEDHGVPYDDLYYTAKDLSTYISNCKSVLVDPDSYKEKYYNTPSYDYFFYSIYKDYMELTLAKNHFDFDDLIWQTILLLQTNETIRMSVHNTIKYIMVDEAQDTSKCQFELINLLTGNNNLMMVGDISQSIYRFRNAMPKYLDSYADEHPNTVLKQLRQNYRSTKMIVAAANNLISHNSYGKRVDMFTDNELGSYITILPVDEHTTLSYHIKNLIKNGKKYGDIAILYRENRQADEIKTDLSNNKIPFLVYERNSFLTDDITKALLNFCSLHENPNDKDYIQKVLHTSLDFYGDEEIDGLIESALNIGDDAISVINNMLGNLDKDVHKHIIKQLSIIRESLNHKRRLCSDVVSYIVNHAGFVDLLRRTCTTKSKTTLNHINDFNHYLESIEKQQKYYSMSEEIDAILTTTENDSFNEDPYCVKLMTAHGSKGLEFDTVIIYSAEEEFFPHRRSCNRDEDIEEERRLFYVAMTRAKKNLCFLCHEGYSRSRFIKEVENPYTPEDIDDELPFS